MVFQMIIIDLHFCAYRAYYSTGNLFDGVIFGVLSQLTNFLQKFKDPFMVITADSKSSLRKEIYPQYKENREKSDDDKKIFYEQLEKLKTYIIPKLGFKVYEEPGYEADDIIGSIVYNRTGLGRLPLVVTGDEDMFQLLNYCRVYFPKKDEIWYSEKFEEEYKIKVSDWVKVKGVAGCTSDCVEGVKGVGESTAIKYLRNELKLSSTKWQNINNFVNSEQSKLNERLVKLPFEGCPVVIPEKPDFKMDNLKEVFSEFKINKIPTFVWGILERG